MTNTTAPDLEIVSIDASTAIIDVNVRTRVALDKAFLESIRTRGVLEPAVGWRDEDGHIHITIGQRRALAAAEAGVPLPVVVKPLQETETVELAEAERVIDQLAENDHRAGLVDAEHAAAYQQLALFGLPIDEIAKRTGAKRDDVRQAVKLSREAPRTLQVMQEQDLTLDQAALITVFEDDEALHQALAESARRGEAEFRAAVKRAEEARRLDQELAEIRDSVPADGTWVEPALAADDDELLSLQYSYDAPVHKETGHRLDAAKAKALGILVFSVQKSNEWREINGEREWVPCWKLVEFARRPEDHGYLKKSPSGRGPLTDAEKQERREKREARAAWKIATEVRHEWLKELLRRTKMPEGALLWVLKAMLHQGDAYHESNNDYGAAIRQQAAVLLGIKYDSRDYQKLRTSFLDAAGKPKGDSTLKVALAVAIASMEERISDPKGPVYGQDARCIAYLAQLKEWGYSLTDTERALMKKKRGR